MCHRSNTPLTSCSAAFWDSCCLRPWCGSWRTMVISHTHLPHPLSFTVLLAGAEKFSETFLGEFDNPEAIWNNEMRQLMIQKIASHISDFTPRLLSNTRATYQVSAGWEGDLYCLDLSSFPPPPPPPPPIVLCHAGGPVPSVGGRVILQHLLPAAPLQHAAVSRLANQRACMYF